MSNRMRLLVIDDEIQIVRGLQRMLKEHDVSSETAPAIGLERVELEARRGKPFELVLCDFNLAGMTGIEVFEKLRVSANRPGLVLMSGDHRLLEKVAQADAVLFKPFSGTELRDVLTRVNAQRQSGRISTTQIENPRRRPTPRNTSRASD